MFIGARGTCIKCLIVIDLEDAYEYMNVTVKPYVKGFLCKKCKVAFDENFNKFEPKQTKGKK